MRLCGTDVVLQEMPACNGAASCVPTRLPVHSSSRLSSHAAGPADCSSDSSFQEQERVSLPRLQAQPCAPADPGAISPRTEAGLSDVRAAGSFTELYSFLLLRFFQMCRHPVPSHPFPGSLSSRDFGEPSSLSGRQMASTERSARQSHLSA